MTSKKEMTLDHPQKRPYLGGGFKCFLFSPLFGEDFQFDEYFSDGWEKTTNQIWSFVCFEESPFRTSFETSNLVVSEVISVRSTGQRLNESLTQ